MERFCVDALHIFKTAVRAVKPETLIKKVVKVPSPTKLQINNKSYSLSQNIHLVGFGKAVIGMAIAIEELIGDHLVSGILSVPNGIQNLMAHHKLTDSKIRIFEGAKNNLPDKEAMHTASLIYDVASSLKHTDILLVLISGGGSALLPLPKPPITLEEKFRLTKLLADHGATVQEINTVRKRISVIKGGGLAWAAKPAQVISLIISDIIGNPLGLIASGPTVRNTDDPQLAMEIIKKYDLTHNLPDNVIVALRNSSKTDVSAEMDFSHVQNVLVGTNKDALSAAFATAKELDYITVLLTTELQGNARFVGQTLANLACCIVKKQYDIINSLLEQLGLPLDLKRSILLAATQAMNENRYLCLLCGGETTVEVLGNGIGGRNQELALSASLQLHSMDEYSEVLLLSAGTDGIDGPTTAAGAIATPTVVHSSGLCAEDFLNDNNSYNFYKDTLEGKWHVITGHTGTNVMDFVIVLLKC